MKYIKGKLYHLSILGSGHHPIVVFLSSRDFYNGSEIYVLEGSEIVKYDCDDCYLEEYEENN